MRLIRALAFLVLAACAPTRPQMYVPNEAEVKECEAQGGSIQPAYALHEYVCFFSTPQPAAPAATSAANSNARH